MAVNDSVEWQCRPWLVPPAPAVVDAEAREAEEPDGPRLRDHTPAAGTGTRERNDLAPESRSGNRRTLILETTEYIYSFIPMPSPKLDLIAMA